VIEGLGTQRLDDREIQHEVAGAEDERLAAQIVALDRPQRRVPGHVLAIFGEDGPHRAPDDHRTGFGLGLQQLWQPGLGDPLVIIDHGNFLGPDFAGLGEGRVTGCRNSGAGLNDQMQGLAAAVAEILRDALHFGIGAVIVDDHKLHICGSLDQHEAVKQPGQLVRALISAG